jgi:hypothetical protein
MGARAAGEQPRGPARLVDHPEAAAGRESEAAVSGYAFRPESAVPAIAAAATLRRLAQLDGLPDGAAFDLLRSAEILTVIAPARIACRAYDHWAREIPRLTADIGACECPRAAERVAREEAAAEAEHRGAIIESVSCFKSAAQEQIGHDDNEYVAVRRNLEQVAAVVQDCPECSRLCQLIAERKHARQQLGVAKRAIRRAGRL